MALTPDRSAVYFDGWYSDMRRSPRRDEIMQRHLRLPAHLLSNSSLTWSGIAEVTAMLNLAPQGRLLDLACGRGSYGIEIAGRTGARLVGVDFSTVALQQARTSAAKQGVDATFVEGDLAATGLPNEAVDAVLCVDAIQFAISPAKAYDEIHRVLKPGGRVVLTSWEAVDRFDDTLSQRLLAVDLNGGLVGAGFTDVEVIDKADWRAAERALWEEAATLDPADDPALQSLHNEAVRSLSGWHRLRRVLAGARRP